MLTNNLLKARLGMKTTGRGDQWRLNTKAWVCCSAQNQTVVLFRGMTGAEGCPFPLIWISEVVLSLPIKLQFSPPSSLGCSPGVSQLSARILTTMAKIFLCRAHSDFPPLETLIERSSNSFASAGLPEK